MTAAGRAAETGDTGEAGVADDDGEAGGESTPVGPAGGRGRRALLVDVAVGVALVAVGVAARWHAAPADGLLYDDAWVVAGASKAGLDDLLTVSTNHPGFTAVLMAWARVVSRSSESFALPVVAAGSLGGAAAYGALRTQRVRLTVALAAALLVVAAPVHLAYSGRVKPYVIETLAGFLLTALVPWAARRRWSWGFVAAWVVGATVVGTLSAFVAVMTGIATLVVALHPNRDRPRRLAALVVQGGLQLAVLLRVQGSFDSARIAREWETTYDGYIELEDGPGHVARQVVTHVRRLGQTLVDDIGSVPAVALVAVAVVGLLVAAWRGDRRVAAQMNLAFLAVAFVGGLVRQVPFGPAEGNIVFPGGRASLWLLPALVVGLAFAAELVAEAAGAVRPALGTAVGVAVLVAGTAAAAIPWDTPERWGSGMGTSARLVDEAAGPGDVVLVHNADWVYAAEPSSDIGIIADPSSSVGFAVTLTRPGTHRSTEWDGTPASMRRLLGDTDRVVVLDGFVGVAPEVVAALSDALRAEGFREADSRLASFSEVTIWER